MRLQSIHHHFVNHAPVSLSVAGPPCKQPTPDLHEFAPPVHLGLDHSASERPGPATHHFSQPRIMFDRLACRRSPQCWQGSSLPAQSLVDRQINTSFRTALMPNTLAIRH